MIQATYTMEKRILDKNTIKKYILVNPRNIRQRQVDSLYRALCEGQHFDTNLVINETQNGDRIIDGNHRITSLDKFFQRYSEEQVECYFAVYHNLDVEQERKIFTRWNLGISQSIDDFIHSYKDTIPMFKRITTELPVSVYGSLTKLKFKDITNAYNASFENPYKGGWAKHSRLQFITNIQLLRDSDVETIKKNFEIIQGVFNEQKAEDIKNVLAFRNIIYRALYYLVANASCDEKILIKKLKKNLVNRTILGQFSRFHGRNAMIDAYNAFYKVAEIQIEVKQKPEHLRLLTKQRKKKQISYEDVNYDEDNKSPKKEITKKLQGLAKELKEENNKNS